MYLRIAFIIFLLLTNISSATNKKIARAAFAPDQYIEQVQIDELERAVRLHAAANLYFDTGKHIRT